MNATHNPPSGLEDTIRDRLRSADEMASESDEDRDRAWHYARGYGDALRGVLMKLERGDG